MYILKRLVTICLTVIGLALGYCGNASGQTAEKPNTLNPQRPVRDKWALVVGISKFQNKQIPELRFASKDAKDFAKYLVEKGNFAPDHVRVLIDERATQRRVMSELGSKFLHRLAQPDDLVVLFFSTHGSPVTTDRRGNNLNYVVAYDSDPEDLFASGIEMQKILESIHRQVLTDRVLLVLDACHSGTLNPNTEAKGISRAANFNAETLAQGSGQMVICSSMPDEQSWESRRYENGVFTRQLLNSLNAENVPALGEVFDLVQKQVTNEVREDRRGAQQTPVLNSKWNGNDLRLAAKPAQPQTIPMTVKVELEPDDSSKIFAVEKITASSQGSSIANQPPSSDVSVVQRTSAFTVTQEPKSAEPATAGDTTLFLDPAYFSDGSDPKVIIRAYTSAIRANPKDPELMYKRATAYIQVSDWMKALSDLCDAQVNTPTAWHFYLARAYVYHRLGQPIQANEDLNQAKFYNQKLPKSIKFK